jgi:hypothetical protein
MRHPKYMHPAPSNCILNFVQDYLNGVIEGFRGKLEEALVSACQPLHSLDSSKWLDLPRVMHISGSSSTSV